MTSVFSNVDLDSRQTIRNGNKAQMRSESMVMETETREKTKTDVRERYYLEETRDLEERVLLYWTTWTVS